MPSTVEGYRVSLRPACNADFAKFYEWRTDLLSFNLLSWMHHAPTVDEFTQQMDAHLRESINFVVVENATGEPIGLVIAYDVNLIDRWCSLLVYATSERRGVALGREAAFLFWDYLFHNFRFRKIYMDVYAFNSGWLDSTPAIEAGLMVEEGCFRRHLHFNGEFWDMRRLALYRERWSGIREFLMLLMGAENVSASHDAEPAYSETPSDRPAAEAFASGRSGIGRIFGSLHASSSRRETLELILNYPRLGKVDEVVNRLAKHVVLDTPMTGRVSGKSHVEKLMRDRQAMVERLEATSRTIQRIVWSEPQESNEAVKIVGTCDSAQIEISITFDSAEQIAEIVWRGPTELLVAHYLCQTATPPTR